MCGMRTTIDKAGRLVIPHQLRERVGLAGGGEVDVQLDGAAIRVAPASSEELQEEGGFLVVPSVGKPISNAQVRELIDADRNP